MSKNTIGKILLLSLVFYLGCEEEGVENGPECTLCEPSTVYCDGEHSIQCNSDGTDFVVISCLNGQYCDESTGLCTQSQCPNLGFRRCANDEIVSVCRDGQLESETCGVGEVCKAGTCIDATFEGETCGYRAVLTGAGTDIAVTECAAGETCASTGTAGEVACVPMVCSPGTRTCGEKADGTGSFLAQTCNLEGTGGDLTKQVDCSLESNSCVDGFCSCAAPVLVSAVQSAREDQLDAVGGSDEGGNPENIQVGFEEAPEEYDASASETKVPDVVEAFLDGEKVSFTSSASAEFIVAQSALFITFSAGLKKVEIYISNVNSGWTGFIDQSMGAFLGYNDGTGRAGEDFSWGAGTSPLGTNYGGELNLFIDKNEDDGGRLKGAFNAVLNDAEGPDSASLEITEGTFDIAFD